MCPLRLFGLRMTLTGSPWEILERTVNYNSLAERKNRTNQGSITTLNGFEDRGGHQAPITPQRRVLL